MTRCAGLTVGARCRGRGCVPVPDSGPLDTQRGAAVRPAPRAFSESGSRCRVVDYVGTRRRLHKRLLLACTSGVQSASAAASGPAAGCRSNVQPTRAGASLGSHHGPRRDPGPSAAQRPAICNELVQRRRCRRRPRRDVSGRGRSAAARWPPTAKAAKARRLGAAIVARRRRRRRRGDATADGCLTGSRRALRSSAATQPHARAPDWRGGGRHARNPSRDVTAVCQLDGAVRDSVIGRRRGRGAAQQPAVTAPDVRLSSDDGERSER